MLRKDALYASIESHFNVNLLTLEMIPLIEKEIDRDDMVSVVFLLYDVPNTAFDRLSVYQRVSKDISSVDSNLLHDWALYAQSRATWKHELIEVLFTCQLYAILRKIGLSVAVIKKYYETKNETFINPLRKELYKLCENVTKNNFEKLKKTLITYDIDVIDHEFCEMVFLDLMCRRFINLNNSAVSHKNDVKNLSNIIENFPDLRTFANELKRLERTLNSAIESEQITSTPSATGKDKLNEDSEQESGNDNNKYLNDFNEIFEEFNKLDLNVPFDSDNNIKSDKLIAKDAYEIKNPDNIGVCLIINQEKFHPSKYSIEGKAHTRDLEDRKGSTNDKNVLIETMKGLNFDVISRDNLNHKEMIDYIKDVIKYRVREDHSMFMLCILSHGTRGHVYAADCVKIKVEDIENILDSDESIHLRDKPKLMILQACQVKDDDFSHNLVADSPKSMNKYYIKKSDIIIYWATAPDYEAFRHEKMGSIFIQFLCIVIKQGSKKDHVNDLFTKVTYIVKKLCIDIKREQLPKVEHTLSKKLYLQIPNA